MKRKQLLIIPVLITLFQCGGSEQPADTQTDTASTQTFSDTLASFDSTYVGEGYESRLKKLPLTENSSLVALELFRDSFKTNVPEENDRALQAYLAFQTKLIDSLTYNIENNPEKPKLDAILSGDTSQYTAEEIKGFRKDLSAKGLRIDEGEGGIYFTRKTEVIAKYFQESLSPSTKEFFSQYAKESNEPFNSDGGIIISIKDLADRLIFWDRFLSNYPAHIFGAHAKNCYRTYLYYLMAGDVNTPAFDRESRKLEKQYSEAYQYIVKKYPTTDAAVAIRQYQKVLSENKNVNNENVEKFVSGFSPYGGE